MLYHLILQGLRNLYFSKLRSSLALLGIIVGTASVVGMVSGGELAAHETLKQFQSLGTDLLSLSISDTNESEQNIMGHKNTLSLEEALNVSHASNNIDKIAPFTQSFLMTYYAGQQLNAITLGVTDSFADLLQLKMKQGRFISLLDKYEPYCVIGYHIYEAIKTKTLNEPLGLQLQINKQLFTIIGVLNDTPENNFIYANINDSILVPILTASLLNQYAAINNFMFRLSNDVPIESIEKIENNIQSYILQYLPNKNITFKSAKELISKMKKQNDILTIFLGLIGSISLIVGGIGVMNIMLVSVIERRTEIGIRLSIGARPSDIVLLFLIETVVLSFLGGLLGIMLGLIVTYGMAWWWQWQFIFFIWPLVIGFLVSVMTGIISGFYPAYLASQMNPIAALRN